MVSSLRRVLTSCSITRACSGSTSMGVTPWKGCSRAPHSLVLQCVWPIETHLAAVSMLPNSLLREPVSRDWSLVYLERLARCPGAEDRQGMADLAALETPEGVASLPAPLHFWAEETARSACWRPLRPGTLAGLADWSPEGTEERRAPCNAVYPALPQRGLPSPVLGLGIRTASEASYWKWRSSDPRHLLGRLGTRVCSGRSQWDTLGRGSQAAGWPTKGTSLLRLASGVLRAASSVPWSGGPAGDGRSSCSRDPRRGGEPPSSATFLGGRD